MSEVYDSLMAKIGPQRIKTSGKMDFIIGTLVGEQWAEPARGGHLGSLQITSDGFVQSGSAFIDHISEVERNIRGYLAVAELTEEELAEFNRLRKLHTQDWRM